MTASSILLAVAPKCPICFLAYFGVFGVATASSSVYRVWLPPLTAIWLALTVTLLAFQRGSQRRYGPAMLGIFASVAVFAGKFLVNNQTLVYAGIVGLVAAAVWRTWSRRPMASEICSPCEITFVHDK
jgi:protein SCO1